jgi:hypothetical protein
LADAEAPAKSLADDLGARYNRGKVPSQNGEKFRGRFYFYDDSADSGKLAIGGERIGGGQGGFGGGGGAPKQEIEQLKQRADSWAFDLKQQGSGRARRIQLSDSDNRPAGNVQPLEEKLAENRLSASSSRELGTIRQPVRSRTEAAGDNVRVLFLISPGAQPAAAAPPSPAAGNRQE